MDPGQESANGILGDERQVVLVQGAGRRAHLLDHLAGVVDFLDLDVVLQVQGGAGADDQRDGLGIGGQLAGPLGLLVLGHQRRPVLELDAEEVRPFLEFLHADAVGEEAFEVPADGAGVAGVRRRRLFQRGQEVTGSAQQRALGHGVDGDDGLRHLRRQRQGHGKVEQVVLGTAGRCRELDAGFACRRRRCGCCLPPAVCSSTSLALPSVPSAVDLNRVCSETPSELTGAGGQAVLLGLSPSTDSAAGHLPGSVARGSPGRVAVPARPAL